MSNLDGETYPEEFVRLSAYLNSNLTLCHLMKETTE